MRRAPAVGWRRLVARTGAALLGFVVLFPPLYAAVVPEERAALASFPAPPARAYRVLVADWGYHTAVVVEQPPGWALGPPGEERAAFLEYAWGDRGFYFEADHRPNAVFAAVALPTESVVYLDGRTAPPALRGARAVYARTVDAATVQRLVRTLERSIRRGPDGRRAAPHRRAAGHAGRFYPATGAYLWARDCNWWTVARLADAGLADRAAGVVFSGQVPARLRGFRPADGGRRDAAPTR